MFMQAIGGAVKGGRAGMTLLAAAALVLALHIACLFLLAAGAGGSAIEAGAAIGRTVGPFFAAALLVAMLSPMRVLLRRADALACRLLS